MKDVTVINAHTFIPATESVDELPCVSRRVVYCNNIITKRDSTRYESLVMLEAWHVNVKSSKLSY